MKLLIQRHETLETLLAILLEVAEEFTLCPPADRRKAFWVIALPPAFGKLQIQKELMMTLMTPRYHPPPTCSTLEPYETQLQ